MNGYLGDFENGKETEWICECLLAPKLLGGQGRRAPFCRQSCKVKIESRTYHECTRQEVLQELIDFDGKYSHPKSILTGDEMGGINEYEKTHIK